MSNFEDLVEDIYEQFYSDDVFDPVIRFLSGIEDDGFQEPFMKIIDSKCNNCIDDIYDYINNFREDIYNEIYKSKFLEKYDEYFSDDNEEIFISKDTVTVNIDDKDIVCNFVTESGVWWDKNESHYYSTVSLVPKQEFLGPQYEGDLLDWLGYGGFPTIFTEEIEEEERAKSLYDIASRTKEFDIIIGFILDNYQNGIGENGWDFLKKVIGD